ncbi:hypothetical protein EVAR_75678_1 [Eumeta japonica]|uniref:Uncharacterized protein n=1 Tax=Eumeta variegata TaxID=151549 RepID=A0A4C1W1U7_EUMVA|nr:hypothetical protein EVAR_75678_1 [Eumeta japonica]
MSVSRCGGRLQLDKLHYSVVLRRARAPIAARDQLKCISERLKVRHILRKLPTVTSTRVQGGLKQPTQPR